MIAASVKDSERLVEFLLSKGADPNEKSEKPRTPIATKTSLLRLILLTQTTPARRSSTSWPLRTTSISPVGSSRTNHQHQHGFVTRGAR